jgi:hypothetical protein
MFRCHVADLGLRSKDELATRRARWNERQAQLSAASLAAANAQ